MNTAIASAAPTRDPLPVVRRAVRDLLDACPAYGTLDPARRKELAQAMVRVCDAAAALIEEEMEADDVVTAQATALSEPAADVIEPRLALAQAVGDTAGRIAGTTRAILNAVSFPRFVTDLINGVFRAMLDSSSQQMQSYVELLNAVAASTDGFADTQMGAPRARMWLVEHYPDAFEMEMPEEDEADLSPEEKAELAAERREIPVRLRPGGKFPSEAALRADLGIPQEESVPSSGDPDRVLVPLVRRKLAKSRQEMLATMVMLGMQRIVIDSGRITASMRFHIDTREALARDEASRLGIENEVTASGSFGYGPWGASASVRNNISYVSTQRSQATEEMNADLDLNSSVEINFRSDYLPLNRLATPKQAEAIRGNTINPEAESTAARNTRLENARAREADRLKSLNELMSPGGAAKPKTDVGDAGTTEAARRAQRDTEAGKEQRPTGKEQERAEYTKRTAEKPGGKPGGQAEAKPAEKPAVKDDKASARPATVKAAPPPKPK